MTGGLPLRRGLANFFAKDELEHLACVRTGIAGAGGIGSNVAFMLARSGLCRLVLVDDDVVEPGNLNRQQYFPADLGRPKVEALADRLHELAPDLELSPLRLRLSADNLPDILPLADVWVEALDGAADKRLFVEAALAARKPVFACSGMGGYGGPPMEVRRLGLLTVVGDFARDVELFAPLAPRVTACAALMADALLESLLQGRARP